MKIESESIANVHVSQDAKPFPALCISLATLKAVEFLQLPVMLSLFSFGANVDLIIFNQIPSLNSFQGIRFSNSLH